MIYQKEEVLILFEELWHSIYKFIIQKFYLEQMKKLVKIQRREREVEQYAIHIINKMKLQKILNAWRFSKQNRILY